MNTSSKNLTIAHIHDPEKDGSIDVEAPSAVDQGTTFDSNSCTSSGDNSADRLVGASNPGQAFLLQGPPTLWETAASVVFCIIGNTVALSSLFLFNPAQRPIPVQHLDDSGEYVRNLTNNEVFKGETIPTIWLFFIGVLGPGCIQG